VRLINYDVGEIADRLSILALKRLHKGDSANSGWKKEQDALQTQLAGRKLNGGWTVGSVELTAVNSAIWHAEDDLRDLRNLEAGERAQWAGFSQPWGEKVASLAIRIQALNDRRAEIVHALNALQGTAQKEKG
jgi:hypothetical protein